jgi:hypothetical protein
MQFDRQTYRLSGAENISRNFLLIGVLGLVAGLAGLFLDPVTFFRSYLIADLFWISLGIGALFFVLMHHLTGSVWSVAVRRLPEAIMSTLPFMALTFLPVLIGLSKLYPWAQHEAGHVPIHGFYLSPAFFMARTAVYFLGFIWMATTLYHASVRQDQAPGGDHVRILRKISARSVVPFAFLCSFASFDWLMSLTPHWYSTIFGVSFFCGCTVGALSLMTLTAIFLQRHGALTSEITHEHYYDLGKLTFAFVIMWTYMAFSQYLLIWYANIPEEVVWYRLRSGPWLWVSIMIPIVQFLVPFVALMSQSAKRNTKVLTVIGLWLLLAHWVNLYWYVMPTFSPTVTVSWMDVAMTVGLGGLFLGWFWRKLTAQPLIPVGDPHLDESLHFESEY